MRDLIRLLLDVEDYYNNEALPLLHRVFPSPGAVALGVFVLINVLLACTEGLFALGRGLRTLIKLGVAIQWKVACLALWPGIAGALAWGVSHYWSNSNSPESAS
jgi:hypothetical protein